LKCITTDIVPLDTVEVELSVSKNFVVDNYCEIATEWYKEGNPDLITIMSYISAPINFYGYCVMTVATMIKEQMKNCTRDINYASLAENCVEKWTPSEIAYMKAICVHHFVRMIANTEF
jgi:hypothetical protein